ncbi:hypothetical protein GFH30_09930 [Acinetobacter wanghuae]|uniref:Uncharacterized protein n=1 Tax=Acinetobacter wanghuae TaxID=2662362 RepID=A0A5Q0P4K1_9GAMM|nr:hypothetical protein [Acinetobacter wanghuae]MQW91421.1 hypothetical protein [Acinetobacter wanghuae]QGA11676.1 hypothetical protein GFH30_09930 [Acinetobacter wanghuae]
MINKSYFTGLFFLTGIAHATLTNLDSSQMQNTYGQGGADLSWTLSLNHRYANEMSLTDIWGVNNQGDKEVYYGYSCKNDIQCRLAFSPNNHKDENENQKWLVFKKIQGTVQIDSFAIEGSTIVYADPALTPKTALNVRFSDANPIKIRNLGFETLSIETDENGGKTEKDKGYMKLSKYEDTFKTFYKKTDGTYADDGQTLSIGTFDKGREKGFMGVNMHGNLHMSGDLKIFGFNCTGNANARC